ncbi:MAG: hypothetical protein R2911_45515 [Caldilineaceae bacterium]
MADNFPTDEDRMIYRLYVHRNMITWMIKRLAEAGIQAERTTGNDPHGDIFLLDPSDIQRVQQIIRQIQAENG